MGSILKDKSFQLSIILTIIFIGTGMIFLFAGLVDFSWVLFGLLPIVLGFAIGSMRFRKYALLVSLITTLLLLLAMWGTGTSGIICVVMAIIIIAPFICLGYVIARLIIRYREIKRNDKLSILVMPLILFMVAAPAEHFLVKDKEKIVEVRTEKIFNYTPEEVYDAIKSVDTLDAEKPFLLQLDLPIPTKCVLEKEEVGALRTCYFKGGRLSNADFGGGTIVERVTQLERGKVLKMDVIDYDLIGRKWIGFKEAIYYFEPAPNNSCKLTRITTYTSILSPRFYWEPMERLGIKQEHDYVFNNLEKDLKNHVTRGK